MWIDHLLLIHSSNDGHLGCSQLLTIVNSAAMNIGTVLKFFFLSNIVSLQRVDIQEKMDDYNLSQPLNLIGERIFKRTEQKTTHSGI